MKFKNIAAVGSPAAVLTSAWRRPEMAKFFSVNVTWETKPNPKGPTHKPLKHKVLSPNNPIMEQIVHFAMGIGSVAEQIRRRGLTMPPIHSRLFRRGAGWVQVYYNVLSWLFCRNAAIPMVPYHTTAMDPAWRLPWLEVPMVLAHPLQSTGGSKRLFPRLYPRVGFVKTSQDYKAGFAAARRSLDLVYTNRSAMAHVALRLPTSGGTGQWPPQLNSPWVYQQLAPTSHGCRSLPDRTESVGAPTDGYADRISENGSYTWQTWRYYKCCKKPGNCMLLFDFG
ncbi:hypothetical protein D3OALGA1CA_382 [Olavius algarvensis associated proteobacterium Delta 3]|nr:hypothetical protein D3OALGA1CA_382 [Olavius algarvensis associated proteobacterium Delta 3]